MNKWRVKCVIEALDKEILMRVIEAWEVTVSRDRVSTRREERSTGRVGSDNEEDEDNGVLSNSEMRRMFKVFMRHTMSTADTTTMAGYQTRKVQGIAHHRDGVDIAKYIAKLEVDLKDIGVCQHDFKAILFQKRSCKSTSQIVATIDRDDCTYDELKQTLIDSLGSGRTGLGTNLFPTFLQTQNIWTHYKPTCT